MRTLLHNISVALLFGLCFSSSVFGQSIVMSHEGNFQARVFGEPKYKTQTFKLAPVGEITVHNHFSATRTNLGYGITYVVAYCDYPADYVAKLGAVRLLNDVRDREAKEVGAIFQEEKVITLGRHPGREHHLIENIPDGVNTNAILRWFVVDNRFYSVGVFTSDADKAHLQELREQFFSSFKLLRE